MTKALLVLAALLFWPLSAQARPRDDVMAQLYRCNGLESDGQWLDCYYGAAQPARAALEMKPALPDQVRLAQSPPASSTARPSDARSRVLAGAGTCYSEPGDRDWLECYYRAAQPMREELGLSVPAKKPALATSDTFGITLPADTTAANRVVSRMAVYHFDGRSLFTVMLENGQTWQQIEGDTDMARWKKTAAAYVVTIRRGFSGSFILTVRNEPHSFRVRRVN